MAQQLLCMRAFADSDVALVTHSVEIDIFFYDDLNFLKLKFVS